MDTPRSSSSRGIAVRRLLAALVVISLVAAAAPYSAGADTRRWEVSETPYDRMGTAEKAVSNVRRGVLGIVDSFAQALFSGFAIASPWGGAMASKIATIVGDVVGLVDNNPVTEHVTRGILSRQLLRFGTRARGFTAGLGTIHDTEFTGTRLPMDDYIGDETFHTAAYGKSSTLATLCAVILSDVLIRPAGGLVTMFGARSTGDAWNEYGLELIQRGTEVEFF